MTITTADIEKVAHLARLNVNAEDTQTYANALSNIFNLIEQMNQLDTANIEPMAHPLNMSQPLRPDAVTETNQRAELQASAPQVEYGVFIVPQVVE
jgi:aspartyl-tRNA(Asn)/glutamyl-tRNA(Gln) amidotransferase subunit C